MKFDEYGHYGENNGVVGSVARKTKADMFQEFATVTEQQVCPNLYIDLIFEEFGEFEESVTDTVGELKEMADLMFVLYGYANAMGYDLDTAFARVARNNIGRCVREDGSIVRREDGKVVKDPDYPKVNLKGCMKSV